MATVPAPKGAPGSQGSPNGALTPNHDLQKRSLEKGANGKPRFRGCAKFEEYEVLGNVGEGTFGVVHKARSRKTGGVVAMKKILSVNEKMGFPITSIREIKLLKTLSHPNVLVLEEMAIERPKGDGKKKSTAYMVMPYMEHDLSGLLENPDVHFTEPQIKCYMLQLLEGIRYLHAQKIMHRDMKAANLLINNAGILQIADFGLARFYAEPPPVEGKGGGEATRDYTVQVVTRWYRPPELLLTLRKYTTAVDMWGVGCVFGEMYTRKPIFMGQSELDQLHKIFEMMGSPNETNMPGFNSLPGCDGVKQFRTQPGNINTRFREQGSGVISLLSQLLMLDWRKRSNAIDALKHPYFTTEPLPAKPGDIPQFAESHELDRRKDKIKHHAGLPPAPAGGTVGAGTDKNGHGPIGGQPRHGGWHANGNGNGQSRGNSGMPRNDRVPAAVGRGPAGPTEHRPPWSRNVNREPKGLPPNPMNGVSANGGRDHGSRQPQSHGSRIDSFRPNYDSGSGGGGAGHNRRGSREPGESDRSSGRDRYYDSDRRRSRSPVRDRQRDRYARSRSPTRSRD